MASSSTTAAINELKGTADRLASTALDSIHSLQNLIDNLYERDDRGRTSSTTSGTSPLQTALSQAQQQLGEIDLPEFPDLPEDPKTVDVPAGPDSTVVTALSALNKAIDREPKTGDLGNISAPALNFPRTPAADAGDAPAVNIPKLNVQFPDVPQLATIQRPVVTPINVPSPNISAEDLPVFSDYIKQISTTPPPAPVVDTTYREAVYTGDPQDFAKEAISSLLLGLMNGTYGLDDKVGSIIDNQVWAKNAEREEQAGQERMQEISRQFAGRGFLLPPGAMLKAMESAQDAIQRARNSASREAALKRVDVIVDGYKFTIDQVRAYSEMLRRFFSDTASRQLEVLKVRAQVTVEVFNAQVAAFNAELNKYRADADIYQAALRAYVERWNAYRAQLEAVKVQGDVNEQNVRIYEAELRAEAQKLDVYKTQIEAQGLYLEQNRVLMDAERLKLEIYRAKIQAIEPAVQLYRAQLEGEATKADVYRTHVQAAAARLQAEAQQYEQYTRRVQAAGEAVKASLGAFTARVQAIGAQNQAIGIVASVKTEHFRGASENAKSITAVNSDRARLYTDYLNAVSGAARTENELELQTKRLAVDKDNAKKDLGMRAAETAIRYSTQLGAAISSSVSAIEATINQ